MGVYAQSLAPGLAWSSADPRHGDWEAAFGRWTRNEAGLPAADLANPALVDGVAVNANTATNLYDTFIVENHESFGPHYQEELWRTSGRNAAHFITAGRPMPQVLTAQPNAEPLWRTLLMVMSDAGEPLMPMVADREHLYGRDVIPLAFLAQVTGDRAAAWAEAAMAERLAPTRATLRSTGWPSSRVRRSTNPRPGPRSPSATCSTGGGRRTVGSYARCPTRSSSRRRRECGTSVPVPGWWSSSPPRPGRRR